MTGPNKTVRYFLANRHKIKSAIVSFCKICNMHYSEVFTFSIKIKLLGLSPMGQSLEVKKMVELIEVDPAGTTGTSVY